MAVIPDTHNTGLTPTQIDTAFSNALTHTPSDSTPKEDGSGSAGEAETFARSDHEHPHDTTKQDTLAFEGTYNASTNKAATMSAVKDGTLTGYAQTSGNVAATDKIIEAIGKVEKKADDNKTNILKRSLYAVFHDINLSSTTINYTASKDDFRIEGTSWQSYKVGMYLVSIVNWSTTPSMSLYACYYSGEDSTEFSAASHCAVSKIAGADAQVTFSAGVISVTASGKVVIYAMA